jgi:hypothetical protein
MLVTALHAEPFFTIVLGKQSDKSAEITSNTFTSNLMAAACSTVAEFNICKTTTFQIPSSPYCAAPSVEGS